MSGSILPFLQEYAAAISATAALLIAIFTIALWWSTRRLWGITKASVDAVRQAERAYVKMSHTDPGLDLVKTIGRGGLTVKIENHGRTPATVSDVLLQVDWFGNEKPAPDVPQYRFETPRPSVEAFLVTKDFFYHEADLQIPNEGVGNELWVYGYVDYRDEFGQRHRAGYARLYLEDRPQNNLVFVDRPGWNYDRLRRKGEGVDW